MAGSSPRVRGKLAGALPRAPQRGLIPARAGKTSAWPRATRSPGAHPRACGENVVRACGADGWCGSSPRVRGKHLRHGIRVPRAGLIPARAGKTRTGAAWTGGEEAHPRACGENRVPRVFPVAAFGSSPRVRGKPERRRRGRQPPGLIPARAGKTAGSASMYWWPRAHPRVCGENPSMMAFTVGAAGSSPRVRGKRGSPAGATRCPGLIPACAGKTAP